MASHSFRLSFLCLFVWLIDFWESLGSLALQDFVEQAGLKATEIHLLLPLGLGLQACATVPSFFQTFIGSIGIREFWHTWSTCFKTSCFPCYYQHKAFLLKPQFRLPLSPFWSPHHCCHAHSVPFKHWIVPTASIALFLRDRLSWVPHTQSPLLSSCSENVSQASPPAFICLLFCTEPREEMLTCFHTPSSKISYRSDVLSFLLLSFPSPQSGLRMAPNWRRS